MSPQCQSRSPGTCIPDPLKPLTKFAPASVPQNQFLLQPSLLADTPLPQAVLGITRDVGKGLSAHSTCGYKDSAPEVRSKRHPWDLTDLHNRAGLRPRRRFSFYQGGDWGPEREGDLPGSRGYLEALLWHIRNHERARRLAKNADAQSSSQARKGGAGRGSFASATPQAGNMGRDPRVEEPKIRGCDLWDKVSILHNRGALPGAARSRKNVGGLLPCSPLSSCCPASPSLSASGPRGQQPSAAGRGG